MRPCKTRCTALALSISWLFSGLSCQVDRSVTQYQKPDAALPRTLDDPPMENLGDPGWRESETPWDAGEYRNNVGMSVWCDETGVFVSLSRDANSPYSMAIVSFNDGTGWVDWEAFGQPNEFTELTRIRGFPDGRLMGVMNGGFFWLDSAGATSLGSSGGQLHVVDDQRAYAIQSDVVIRFDVDHWEPVSAALPHAADLLWANDETVFVTSQAGAVLQLVDGEWIVHDTNTTDGLTAIWGFASDDVWVATHRWDGAHHTDLLHFDGISWEQTAFTDPRPAQHRWPINGMWGTAGVLYFYSSVAEVNRHSSSTLFRTDGEVFETVADWGCYDLDTSVCPWTLVINDMWGNSPQEVFLAVSEYLPVQPDYAPDEQAFVLWFDGTLFHWF